MTWLSLTLLLLFGGEQHSWAQWRGPLASGFSPHATPPLRWSEQSNVRWKIPLPGKGLSTPVVWKDRIFVTSAVPTGDPVPPRPETADGAHDNLLVSQSHEYVALAVSRKSGEVLWKRTLHTDFPHEGGHTTGSYASPSPVCDAERVFCYFGSQGLFALGHDGEVYWKKDFGDMQTKHGHGEGASPALYGDTLVVNWDHEAQSFIVALDKESGEERWRTERDEVTSWSTPIITEVDGQPQVIVNGTTAIRGYDLATGEVIWSCGGLSHNVVASPIFADGVLYAASSYEKQAMIAVDIAGAKGELALDDERIRWYRRKLTPYVPSPVLIEDSLYVLQHYQPTLAHVLRETGKDAHRPLRVGGIGNVYASPVAAAGHLFITDLEGTTAVLEHGEGVPKLVALNPLDDSFSASAVLVDSEVILRGDRFLYCIAAE